MHASESKYNQTYTLFIRYPLGGIREQAIQIYIEFRGVCPVGSESDNYDNIMRTIFAPVLFLFYTITI